jgi:hypothetical protein
LFAGYATTLLAALLACLPCAALAKECGGPGQKKCIRVINLTAPLDPPPGSPEPGPAPQPEPGPGPSPQPQPRPQPDPGRPAPKDLAASVLQKKLGTEGFERLKTQLESSGCGSGAPCAHTYFDRAAPASGTDNSKPQGTKFFGGGYNDTSVVDARRTVNEYGGIPGGGVVLQGEARGLASIEEIGYDRKFNAFILDGRAAYFLKIPPDNVAELCRALAVKDQVGVSLGRTRLVYGAVPKDSEMAFDLMLADRFLGDIVFARNDWTRGYRFANGYSPAPDPNLSGNIAVFFRFGEFEFTSAGQEIALARAKLDVTLVPLSSRTAPDGNLLPDEAAIAAGSVSAPFKANARHISDNIDYYRREQIVQRAFAYGEAAAFLRWLRSEGADLAELAGQIE